MHNILEPAPVVGRTILALLALSLTHAEDGERRRVTRPAERRIARAKAGAQIDGIAFAWRRRRCGI
jgi:hypothetical protein